MGPETEYALIPLTKGQAATVDWADDGRVSAHKWSFGPRYAFRRVGGRINGKSIYMHRFIISTPANMLTDHANRNRLDNRRRNLRACNRSQNATNSAKRSDGQSSRFKGVSWHSGKQKWCVYVGSEFVGRYSDEFEAAKAYNVVALKKFGEFALLNEVAA